MRSIKFNNDLNESFPIIEGLADYIGDDDSTANFITSPPSSMTIKQQVMQHHDYQGSTLPQRRQTATVAAIHNHDYHDNRILQQQSSQTVQQQLHSQQYQSHSPLTGGSNHILTRTIPIGGSSNFHPQLVNRANLSPYQPFKNNIQIKHGNMVSGPLQKSSLQQRRILTSRYFNFLLRFELF